MAPWKKKIRNPTRKSNWTTVVGCQMELLSLWESSKSCLLLSGTKGNFQFWFSIFKLRSWWYFFYLWARSCHQNNTGSSSEHVKNEHCDPSPRSTNSIWWCSKGHGRDCDFHFLGFAQKDWGAEKSKWLNHCSGLPSLTWVLWALPFFQSRDPSTNRRVW